jgi:hypothetical protein
MHDPNRGRIMLSIFRRKLSKPIQDKHMEYFSQEFLTKLINEHKLVNASIHQLTDRYKQYLQAHSPDALTAALTSLRGKKVELEAKIDVVGQFLNS